MTKLLALSLVPAGVLAAASGVASADATDDYPVPNRILTTACTVDRYMAAVRDVEPLYYERYMTDYNGPVDV